MAKTLQEEVEKAKEIFLSRKEREEDSKPFAPRDCTGELVASYSEGECIDLLREALREDLVPIQNLENKC